MGSLGIIWHLSIPGYTAVWLEEAEEADRVDRLPFTSLTSLIWFQLRQLSGIWGFDFCVSVTTGILLCV